MDENIIYDEYNIEFKITKELSRGGQGVVFRTTDENILIKIEFEKETESNNDESKKKYSKDLRNNEKFKSLRLLPISRNINITLPKSVLKEYVGYTMDILSDMESLEKVFSMSNPKQANDWTKLLLKSSEELSNQFSNYILTGGKRKRLIVFLEIAKILSNLHMNGLVYCDLSPNNVFVTSKGNYINTWLIDADNINYQEETLQNGFYTPKYGAPEVIKGKGCTFYSDSYTLAVMLFEELVNNHPFRGSAEKDNWDNDEILDENTLTFEEKLHYGLLPWIFFAGAELGSNLPEKINKKLHIRTECFSFDLFRMIRTTSFLLVVWFVVCSPSLRELKSVIRHLFIFSDIDLLLKLPKFSVSYMLLIVLLVDYLNYKGINVFERFEKQNLIFRWIVIFFFITIILLYGHYGPNYNAANFIYGGF